MIRTRAFSMTLSMTILVVIPVRAIAAEHGHDKQGGEYTAEMSPVDILEKEHVLISEVAGAIEGYAQHIQKTGAVDAGYVEEAQLFFWNFADRCHHAKEESYLFASIRHEASEDVVDLLDELSVDHAKGRLRLAKLREALERYQRGEDEARSEVARAMKRYASNLALHIEKENEQLFQSARPRLTEASRSTILHGFDYIEDQALGKGAHERYHAMAVRLIEAAPSAQPVNSKKPTGLHQDEGHEAH